MDLATLIERLEEDGLPTAVVNNPLAQFGPPTQPFLGAQILPERQVNNNFIKEEAIRFISYQANAGTRYSPTSYKDNALTATMTAGMLESDAGAELNAPTYEALLRVLNRGGRGVVSQEAADTVLDWVETGVGRPLQIYNERQRWQAIVSSQVVNEGVDAYVETVTYSNPAGHRFAAGGVWSNDAYDPMDDISAGAQLLENLGMRVSRIICRSAVRNKLRGNALMAQRLGKISIAAGTVVGIPSRLTNQGLNEVLGDEEIPAIEIYDGNYATQTVRTNYYIPSTVLIMLATTGRTEVIDSADVNPLTLQNTLGYQGVGIPTGQTRAGRVIFLEPKVRTKPPTIQAQGWQTGLTVIQDPEAIVVITGIS